jgi:CRISPR-associated endonuclease/helicase Cas3
MLEINILPTYSELSNKEEIDKLDIKMPENWKNKLSKHQVETYKAFKNSNTKIIFNTAMTGDGKSLAGLLPALQGECVISMYPTNELITDQVKNFDKYPNENNSKFTEVYGKSITEQMANSDIQQRYQFIEKIFHHNKIIFTNPDLFHLMMTHQYGGYGDAKSFQANQLPYLIPTNFNYFIFDEFHIYKIPQIISVINILNYIESKERDKKYIFLSATPNDAFIELLEKSGISYEIIEGSYSDTKKENYRRILENITVNISWINQDTKTFDWIKSNVDTIKNIISRNKKFKGAIIVDSIVLAKEIKSFLKEKIPEIKIIENTGLTIQSEKQEFKNSEYGLVVATSTVDIGVDFEINFLVFEASNSGSFLQRLGRLGRHSGFSEYNSYALIPRHVYDKLEVSELLKEPEVSRMDFNKEIKNVFTEYNSFKPYIKKWGNLQSYQIVYALDRAQNSKDLRERLVQRLNKVYYPEGKSSIESVKNRFYAMVNNKDGKLIIDQLNTFRGSGSFDCAIKDMTDGGLKTYDLFFLLKNTEFELIEKDEFEKKFIPLEERVFFKYCKFHILLRKYKDKNETLYFQFDGDIDDDYPEIINDVKVRNGLAIRESGNNPVLQEINKTICKENMVCFISDCKPKDIKTLYKLPIHFPIFTLKDYSNSVFSIAFNKEALLLDSIMFWKKNKNNGCIVV